MKKEELFQAMGSIDETYVNEGRENPGRKAVQWKKWTGIALAAAAVFVIAGGSVLFFRNSILTRPKAPIEKHMAASRDSTSEITEIPRWEEMPDVQRYAELSFEGRTYRSNLIYVHPENEGETIGSGTLTGSDVYTDEIHTVGGIVKKIAGIRTEAAVAVYFPDEPDRGYAYANAAYVPKTLGEFIADVNLRNTLKTGLVYTVEGPGKQDVVYEDVPMELVWSMLLSDETIVNEPDKAVGRRVLGIDSSVDLLGYHHKTISLTEDGYLWTNLLDSGKYFFIGEEKVRAFLKEVTEKHQGYVYIYDVLTGEYDE